MKCHSTGKLTSPLFYFGGFATAVFLTIEVHAADSATAPASAGAPQAAQQASPQAVHQTVRLALKEDASSSSSSSTLPKSLGDILRVALLQAIDEEYVDERKWGRTTERFDGFHVQGLRISKRERRVNHGFWQRYRVRLVRPEETLKIDVKQEPGVDDRINFTLSMQLRAHCEATFAWWNYGVKGLNGTAVSEATIWVRLDLETNPQFKFSLESPFPRVDFDPKVKALELKLKDIDLHRLGVFDGPVVSLIGDGSRKAVEDLLQQRTEKLKGQLQKQLSEPSSP